MKFKKRAISLLLALLLIFNSSPIGHASRGDEISINGDSAGTMKTNLGGKLSLSVELGGDDSVEIKVSKVQ